jgi:uncharacterized protein with HEPN domain
MLAHPARVALVDMRDAMRRIARYTRGRTLSDFRRDSLVRDAVERCIEIVSEASRRLPDDLKAKHPQIPWPKVAAIGNVFRHEYDEIYPPLVWEIVQTDLPVLRRAVNAMLREIDKE